MENDNTGKQFSWGVAIVASAIVIVSGFGLIAYLTTEHDVKKTADHGIDLAKIIVDKMPEVAEKFRNGNITQFFYSSLPTLQSTEGNVLELAISKSHETFKRTEELTTAWGYLHLGTTVAEIRAPVTFRYHLLLSDTWRLASKDNLCVVLAPNIRPSLPPAIHTGEIEKRSESGWARFNKDEKLNELERDLTAALELRAKDSNHQQLVRETCRKSVGKFVKTWLMREDHWRTNRFSSITVLFPDEVSSFSTEELLSYKYEPTLRLN